MFPQSGFELLASLFECMGAELVICFVSIIVGLAMRSASCRVACKNTKAKLKQAGSPASPSRAPTAEKRKATGNWRQACQQPQPPASKGKAAAPSAESLVDQIMAQRYDPSQRALQLYGELRPLLGLAGEQAEPSLELFGKRRASAADMYGVLIQAAVRVGQCHVVDRLIDDMMRVGVARTLVFYESTMKQLAGQKQYSLALACYDRMHQDGLRPSPDTLSCLINFANEVGEFHRAVGFFDQLAATAKPSIRACMTTLRVYAKLGDFTSSVGVLRSMEKQGVEWDCLALNLVLATGVTVGKAVEAAELLEEAVALHKQASDIVSYNTVLKGHVQRGDNLAAGRLVQRMKAAGLRPNAITFHTLMDAAVRSNQVGEAWSFLDEMHAEGLSADKFTCSILVKAVAKEPTAEHISGMLRLMQSAGASFDPMLRSSLYHSVLDAASRSIDDAPLKQVVLQMRQQQIPINDMARKRIRDRIIA